MAGGGGGGCHVVGPGGQKITKIAFNCFFVFYAISSIFSKTILSHFVFSLRFILFTTFLEQKFQGEGGGGGVFVKKSQFMFSSYFMLIANIFYKI